MNIVENRPVEKELEMILNKVDHGVYISKEEMERLSGCVKYLLDELQEARSQSVLLADSFLALKEVTESMIGPKW